MKSLVNALGALAVVAGLTAILFAAVIPTDDHSASLGPPGTTTVPAHPAVHPLESSLDALPRDGMRSMSRALGTNTNPPVVTNSPPTAPTFADGVLIATSVIRSNPGFASLLTPSEQVALCARVWQAARGSAK